MWIWDFPGGPVVKNLSSKAGDEGSIPGQGTKSLHAMEQLDPCTETTRDNEDPVQPKVNK